MKYTKWVRSSMLSVARYCTLSSCTNVLMEIDAVKTLLSLCFVATRLRSIFRERYRNVLSFSVYYTIVILSAFHASEIATTTFILRAAISCSQSDFTHRRWKVSTRDRLIIHSRGNWLVTWRRARKEQRCNGNPGRDASIFGCKTVFNSFYELAALQVVRIDNNCWCAFNTPPRYLTL